jgi:HD-like signal output (HDOD) protein
MQDFNKIAKTFIKELHNSQDLPVLPQVHLQAMRIASDPKSNSAQLHEILKHDPVLASKILKVANSSYYGFRNRIESLKTAIVMLGVEEILRLIAATSVYSAFGDTPECEGFEKEIFWFHSACVGAVAGAMAKEMRLPSANDLYTGGLLHAIGEILLASSFSNYFKIAFDHFERSDTSLTIAQKEVLGIDYAEIGTYLGTKWTLPDPLISMIKHHLDPAKDEEYLMESSVIYLAKEITFLLSDKCCKTEKPKDLLSDPVWDIMDVNIWDKKTIRKEFVDNMKPVIEASEKFVSGMLG